MIPVSNQLARRGLNSSFKVFSVSWLAQRLIDPSVGGSITRRPVQREVGTLAVTVRNFSIRV